MLEEEGVGKDYQDGEIIFRENEHGSEMYVILHGKVKVFKESRGVETTLALLKEGEIFGEMALFDKRPRSATAKAAGYTRLAILDRDTFLSLVKRDPVIALQILEKLSNRLRQVDEELQKTMVKDREARDHVSNFMRYRGML